MFAIIAALIFILAAFNVHMGEVNLVALGLCAVAIHLFIGHALPLGAIRINRRAQ